MVGSKEESVVFPVILYDGKRETDVGSINIHHTLDFKQFQVMLKETIGISYNNLTTYLVDGDKSKTPSERRKILITGKVNFSFLVKERNCYFLVVLKRSRRDRRRKLNKQSSTFEYAFAPSISAEYLMPMQLDPFDPIEGRYLSVYDSFVRNMDLEMKKIEKCSQVMYPQISVECPKPEEAYSVVHGSRALCKDCTKAEKQETKAAFHFCVYDVVVEGGFRSLVGPISRPK